MDEVASGVTLFLDKAFDHLQAAKHLFREGNPALFASAGLLCYAAIEAVLIAGCYFEKKICHDMQGLLALIGKLAFLQEVNHWPGTITSLSYFEIKADQDQSMLMVRALDWQGKTAIANALRLIDVIADAMPESLHEIYCLVLKLKHII